MSKISLKPNASGTGVFSLEAPNSNSDRTLNLPDEAGTVLTNVSDISAANLTGDVAAERITGALNATGSAPVYACRAWVNFDGTGPTIRESGNVSSITDNGTGDYTVNFATNMPDANYSAVASATNFSTNINSKASIVGHNTSSVELLTGFNNAGSSQQEINDRDLISLSIFR